MAWPLSNGVGKTLEGGLERQRSEMRTVAIEESREMYGLLIIAAWMGVLALRAWRGSAGER